MSGTRGAWDEAREQRAIKLLTSRRDAVRPQNPLRFSVASSDGARLYSVRVDTDGWSCSCDDWTGRESPCKHVLATVRWLDPNPPPILDEQDSPPRSQSFQHWPAYDAAQQAEHPLFDALAWDLIQAVPEKLSEVGKRGRPAIPIRTQLLIALKKVHSCESARRARGLMVVQNWGGKGIIDRIPNYAVSSRFFNRGEATDVLGQLIEMSAAPLKEIEDGGTVAIDSTGFCTSCMGAYCTEKHDPQRRHSWVKAHLAVGVKTHIVLSAKVTDEHGGDSPQFLDLLRRVRAGGHGASRVVADKAYLSRANLAGADELGFDPFIPFKVNSRGFSKGSPIWNRKYHEFMARREEFDEFYHKRSNVESVNWAIKRKLGEPVSSRTPLARINEVLAKILAYNIGVIVHEIYEHGVDPGVLGLAKSKPRPPILPSMGTVCDSSPTPVTEIASSGPGA